MYSLTGGPPSRPIGFEQLQNGSVSNFTEVLQLVEDVLGTVVDVDLDARRVEVLHGERAPEGAHKERLDGVHRGDLVREEGALGLAAVHQEHLEIIIQ